MLKIAICDDVRAETAYLSSLARLPAGAGNTGNAALAAGGGFAAAERYRDLVLPRMSELRAAADELETLTGRADWPFPTYGDLLFSV